MLSQDAGLQRVSKIARAKKKEAKRFKAHGSGRITNSVLSLATMFQGVEEIAYSELSMKEKVEMILMQTIAIILMKQQNLIFWDV